MFNFIKDHKNKKELKSGTCPFLDVVWGFFGVQSSEIVPLSSSESLLQSKMPVFNTNGCSMKYSHASFFTACANYILHFVLQFVHRQSDLHLKRNTLMNVFENLGRQEIGSLICQLSVECSEMLGLQSAEQKLPCWFELRVCLYTKNVLIAFILEALFGAFINTLPRRGELSSAPVWPKCALIQPRGKPQQ